MNMAENDLTVFIEEYGKSTIVCPSGDIDLSRSSILREHLHPVLDMVPQRIIVDLNNVEYMDSSGVATLVEALQLAKRSEIRLILCGLGERVRSIIELARLDQIFEIVDSREQAMAE